MLKRALSQVTVLSIQIQQAKRDIKVEQNVIYYILFWLLKTFLLIFFHLYFI